MEVASAQPDDLPRLLSELLEDTLDEAGWKQLERRIETDPAARALYVELVSLDALLQREGAANNDLTRYVTGGSVSPEELYGDSFKSLHDASILPVLKDVDEGGGEAEGEDQHQQAAMSAESELRGTDRGATFSHLAVKGASQSRTVSRWRLSLRNAAASVLVAVSLAMLVAHTFMNRRSRAADVATLTGTIDARWENAQGGLADGATLPLEQSLSLRSGWAELAYPNGVVVTIQGPARFRIKAGQTVSLDSGKLVALVPKAGRGFAVQTPSARIVDLGTEFGVAVSSAGQTDVDTFRGTVSLTPARGDSASVSTLLTAGFARHVTPAGDIAEAAVNETAFVRPRQFDDWNSTHAAGYDLWRVYSERLRHDPDVVAYYTFDNAARSPDRLLNESSLGSALDGVLAGDQPTARPTWTTGRWPEKGALEFSGSDGSRVVVPSGIGDPLDFSRGPQPASPLTIAAWIRPEARGNGIIVAKGSTFSEQYAMDMAYAWVRRAVGSPRELTGLHTSYPAEGVWSQMVFTYDPVQRSGRLYRNGLLISQGGKRPTRLLSSDAPVFIGGRPDRLSAKPVATVPYVGGLHGLIDEVLIMKRAMSAHEVREMYKIGKPD